MVVSVYMNCNNRIVGPATNQWPAVESFASMSKPAEGVGSGIIVLQLTVRQLETHRVHQVSLFAWHSYGDRPLIAHANELESTV